MVTRYIVQIIIEIQCICVFCFVKMFLFVCKQEYIVEAIIHSGPPQVSLSLDKKQSYVLSFSKSAIQKANTKMLLFESNVDAENRVPLCAFFKKVPSTTVIGLKYLQLFIELEKAMYKYLNLSSLSVSRCVIVPCSSLELI